MTSSFLSANTLIGATYPIVAIPPKKPYRSTIAVFAPCRAAAIAAMNPAGRRLRSRRRTGPRAGRVSGFSGCRRPIRRMKAVRATRPMQPIRLLLFSGKVSSISFSYGVWEISEFLSGDLCRQAMKKIANTQESRIRHPSAARRTRRSGGVVRYAGTAGCASCVPEPVQVRPI